MENILLNRMGGLDLLEGVADARQAALNSMTAFNRIAMRAQGLLARQQLRALERCLEAGTRQLRLVAEVRDSKDLLISQAEVAKQLGEELLAVAHESTELQAQVRSELEHWATDGIKSVQATGAETSQAKTTRAKTVAAPKLKAAPRRAGKAA